MKLRYKITGGLLALVVVAVAALAVVLSYGAPCEPVPAPASGAETMKAVVARCYGSPDILAYEDVAKPTPGSEEVLVRIHAAAVEVTVDERNALGLARRSNPA